MSTLPARHRPRRSVVVIALTMCWLVSSTSLEHASTHPKRSVSNRSSSSSPTLLRASAVSTKRRRWTKSDELIAPSSSPSRTDRPSTTTLVVANDDNAPSSSPITSATTKTPSSAAATLRTLQAFTFLTVLSASLVALTPAPVLVERLGAGRATATLSAVSAAAAATEIVCAPALGRLLDVVGRAPPMVAAAAFVSLVQGTAAVLCGRDAASSPAWVVSTARLLGSLSTFVLAVSSQTMIADAIAVAGEGGKADVGALLGVRTALMSLGFLCGSVGAGQLTKYGVRVTYAASSLVAAGAALLARSCLAETLPPNKRRSTTRTESMGRVLLSSLRRSPLSFARFLFAHSRRVTVLGVLLVLQSLPMSMGDTFQVFARTEWGLSTADFALFLAGFGVVSITGNVLGGALVGQLGARRFVSIAVASSALSPALTVLTRDVRGLALGAALGCLGPALGTGLTAAVVEEGDRLGVPQGELAGDRSSLTAFVRIVGPLWYSTLYVQGRRIFGTSYAPFWFNVATATTAFVVCRTCWREEEEE